MDHDYFLDDEILRAFFGQSEMFRTAYVYRSRTNVRQQRVDLGSAGSNFILLLQLLPFFIIILLAYLPFSEPEYSLQKNYSYQFEKMTDKIFVKSAEFDKNYPLGSPAPENIEDHVISDYKSTLGRYCHIELQRRQWNRNYPTPHCDRLQNFGCKMVRCVQDVDAVQFDMDSFCILKVKEYTRIYRVCRLGAWSFKVVIEDFWYAVKE
ncbi:hypothetical protein RND71_007976 [Anisodus tanguticus]|uniref:Uncharacterized protein n=1 Tax=Anisodus tanguticus TaxID=243964 RepID=A0AAE1VKL4_9SOLA|nr:hypothetical protein RND71_007976 [Anisodus tanguticus]